MNRKEIKILAVGYGQSDNLSDVLCRPNIPLSERLDSGDDPFERIRGINVSALREQFRDFCETSLGQYISHDLGRPLIKTIGMVDGQDIETVIINGDKG